MSRKILCVDDMEQLHAVISVLLSGEGFEVLCAATNEEALAILQSEGDDISLVISDINRPVGCGVSAEELLAMGISPEQGGLWFFAAHLAAEAHRRPCVFLTGLSCSMQLSWVCERPGCTGWRSRLPRRNWWTR